MSCSRQQAHSLAVGAVAACYHPGIPAKLWLLLMSFLNFCAFGR